MELHSSVCSSCRAHSKAHRQKRKTTGYVICQSFRIFNFDSGSVPASVAVTMESAVTVPLPAAPAIAIVVVRSVMIPVTAPAASIPAPPIVTGPAVKASTQVRPVIDVQLHFAGATCTAGTSAASDTRDRGCGVERVVAGVCATLRGEWAAIDRAGEAAAGLAAASAVHGAQRAAADGAVELQPVVPLVCGAEHGRRGVGADGVHQEPRPFTGRRYCGCVFRWGGGEDSGARAAE